MTVITGEVAEGSPATSSTAGLTLNGWLLVTRRFAAKIGASSSRTYPIVRERDGELVKFYVRDAGWYSPDGTPL